MHLKKIYLRGYSLIEIMVVILIFALLGVLVTQSLTMSIRGSKKSETLSKTRSTLSYVMGIVERQLRNANGVVTCENNRVDYKDEFGTSAYFRCDGNGIASGSATLAEVKLINDLETKEVIPSSCSISCVENEGNPTTVNVSLGASGQLGAVGSSNVTVESKIMLRNY